MPKLAAKDERLEIARKLMDDFARRTGLSGKDGNVRERYLWTDAFAVQTFFGLSHALGSPAYRDLALRLIDEVHRTLGRFREDDIRKGWISGLPEGEGLKHPAAGGLRIGKDLPERKADEPLDDQLEWERDGQYFHYLTRWVQALLCAFRETGERRYAEWAVDLMQAGGKFIEKRGGRHRMFWKMSIDLSRPLVHSMGEHDPLDGLICAESVVDAIPERAYDLETLIYAFESLCEGRSWSTTDALGIGGLLLDVVRAAELALKGKDLPVSIRPEKLLADSVRSLEIYRFMHESDLPAEYRLAFRECGLSLGLRVAFELMNRPHAAEMDFRTLGSFGFLADDIEEFWTRPQSQTSPTWTEHENINAVTLAASLVAKDYPAAFS